MALDPASPADWAETRGVMSKPWLGVSLMHEPQFAVAAAPLFREGVIDAVEWAIDSAWSSPPAPWFVHLLDRFADAGRLFGHGVTFSALSVAPTPARSRWLRHFEDEVRRRPYVHVSEHYGCMTTPRFTRGAPAPMPHSRAALAVMRRAFGELESRAPCPVGIENLGLALCATDAQVHGAWLERAIHADTGFILLDVHNLYCQARNFGIVPEVLLASFPLERVREIHVSGGSELPAWPGDARIVRCDTHDDAAPPEVFALARQALQWCPNVQLVVYERLGHTLGTEEAQAAFRDDVMKLRALIDGLPDQRGAEAPARQAITIDVADDDEASLASFQDAMLGILRGQAAAHVATWKSPPGDQALCFQVRHSLQSATRGTPYARWIAAADDRALGIATRAVATHLRDAQG